MTGTGIGVADVLRALDALRPADDDTTSAVVALLGFDLLPPAGTVEPTTPDDVDLDTEEVEAYREADEGAEIELLTPISHDSAPLDPRTDWRAAEPVDEHPIEVLTAPLPHQPLLLPRRAPSIIAAAAATVTEEDAPDPEALVEMVAEGRPVQRIPHRRRRTLIRGVQVLLDHGKGMEPFARDQVELLRDIRSVVGRSAVERVSFRNAPTRGALPAGQRRWQAYTPPPAGTPVLAVTDLGIGGPPVYPARAQSGEWVDLAAQLGRRGSALVALVPYPPSRWPPQVAAAVPVVTWDRKTTLSAVLTALRRSGRLG
jgi:hypothetical protein